MGTLHSGSTSCSSPVPVWSHLTTNQHQDGQHLHREGQLLLLPHHSRQRLPLAEPGAPAGWADLRMFLRALPLPGGLYRWPLCCSWLSSHLVSQPENTGGKIPMWLLQPESLDFYLASQQRPGSHWASCRPWWVKHIDHITSTWIVWLSSGWYLASLGLWSMLYTPIHFAVFLIICLLLPTLLYSAYLLQTLYLVLGEAYIDFMLSRGREKSYYDDDMEEEPFDFRRISV